MHFQEFKDKYQDVLACPLDIEIPDIDTDKLLAWAAHNHDCEYQIRKSFGSTLTKEEYDKAHKDKLAFFDSFFLLTGMPGNPSTWYRDFDKEFPEIAAFADMLPIVGAKQFGFILQKNPALIREFNPKLISHIHTDEDNNFGLRMYLNSTKNRMLFYGIREGDIRGHKQSSASIKSLEAYHTLDQAGDPVYDGNRPVAHPSFHPIPLPTKFTKPNQVFIMNNIKAAHYVEHEEDPNKITFLLMGRRSEENRYDWAELDKYIQASMINCPEEVLYYQDIVNAQINELNTR